MERFTQVAPQIKATELENTVADKHQKEEQKEAQTKLEKDPKFFIKQNMRVVKKIDKQYRTAKLHQDIEEDLLQQKAAVKRGVLPNYLV